MSLIEEKTLADHDINVRAIRQELQLLEEQLKKHGRNKIQPSLTPNTQKALDDNSQHAQGVESVGDDTIRRKQAIDAIADRCDVAKWGRNPKTEELVWTLEKLPSAQPETHEERTETHACDLIDRQAAIDALVGVTMFKTKHEIMQRVNASVQDEQGWLGAVAECLDEIEDLPSAQPEMIREIRKWINSGNRGNADYFIVEKIEEIINKYE